jgi:hypothetical protein
MRHYLLMGSTKKAMRRGTEYAPLPAYGINKEGYEEGGTDGAAQVDAGQLVDLTRLDLKVGIFSGDGGV